MVDSNNPMRPPIRLKPRLPMKIGLNASRRPAKSTTEHGATRPGPQSYQNTQEDEIQKLHRQNIEKRQQRLGELSASDPEYTKELDLKECMLEVQAVLIGRLAAEENHLKGLVETSEPSDVNFDERVKDVEEAIQALQY